LSEIGRGTGVAGVADGRGWEWYWGVLVVDYLVLGSVAEAVRGESGAQAAGSGAVAAVGSCQVLSVLLKRRARGPARLVWPGRGAGCGLSGAGECC
jgi:hypothetical protein